MTNGAHNSSLGVLLGIVLACAMRSRHGKAKAHGIGPVIEALPVNELPAPVQAVEQAPARPERDALGRYVKGAKRDQRRGGKAKRQWGTLAAEIGAIATTAHPEIAPDIVEARRFFQALCMFFMLRIGGGEFLGPHVLSLLQRAAIFRAVEMATLRLALGPFFITKPTAAIDKTKEKPKVNDALLGLAERMGAASTRNILAAWEMCAKLAGRHKVLPPLDHAALALAMEEAGKPRSPEGA